MRKRKIIEIRKIREGILKIRIEATKRKALGVKIRNSKFIENSCNQYVCPLYKKCFYMRSPLKQYASFGDFCNELFNAYPDLKTRLKKFGVKNINQVVPIKRIGK
jgi:hypothetical protein